MRTDPSKRYNKAILSQEVAFKLNLLVKMIKSEASLFGNCDGWGGSDPSESALEYMGIKGPKSFLWVEGGGGRFAPALSWRKKDGGNVEKQNC